MSVARINLSHGSSKITHGLLRHYNAAKKLRPYKTCALMMDVRGRTLRTSKFAKDCDFLPDDTVEIRTDGVEIDSTHDEI